MSAVVDWPSATQAHQRRITKPNQSTSCEGDALLPSIRIDRYLFIYSASCTQFVSPFLIAAKKPTVSSRFKSVERNKAYTSFSE